MKADLHSAGAGAAPGTLPPAVLAIAGIHNSGKTTLLEKLLPRLAAKGVRCAVIKHDGHDFTPDVPGTDSYKLRGAGAAGVAVYSAKRYLVYEEAPLDETALIAHFEASGRYDLILLEGFKNSTWPKIEVVRSAVGSRPVSSTPLAIAGDTPEADFPLDEGGADELAAYIKMLLPALRTDRAVQAAQGKD